MSSVSSTIIDQNEQTQATTHRYESSAASSAEEMVSSSVASTSTPILTGEIVTENDHEDNLIELIDELIRNFLSRANRRSPYRSLFRWTFDDTQNFSYSVIVKIEEPSRLI